VPLLVAHFVEKFAKERVPDVESDALEVLMAWDWPGNVRELENAMERAVVLSKEGRIGVRQLPPHIIPEKGDVEQGYLRVPLGSSMREVEDLLIKQAMEISGGDKQKAATLLGISARTITRHLR
jgi:DNA-binding NtrC family response regulator